MISRIDRRVESAGLTQLIRFNTGRQRRGRTFSPPRQDAEELAAIPLRDYPLNNLHYWRRRLTYHFLWCARHITRYSRKPLHFLIATPYYFAPAVSAFIDFAIFTRRAVFHYYISALHHAYTCPRRDPIHLRHDE